MFVQLCEGALTNCKHACTYICVQRVLMDASGLTALPAVKTVKILRRAKRRRVPVPANLVSRLLTVVNVSGSNDCYESTTIQVL